MQPSPTAETSKLLFPNLRFCISSPLTVSGPNRFLSNRDHGRSRCSTNLPHLGPPCSWLAARRRVSLWSSSRQLRQRAESRSAWTAGRSPLARRCSLPLVKCPDEGVRVFVAQQIRSLVQFERGTQQVVLCHFPPRFFHQALKRQSLCEQAPL